MTRNNFGNGRFATYAGVIGAPSIVPSERVEEPAKISRVLASD